MTQDHIVGTRRGYHGSRNLTGVGTAGVVGAVLCSQTHLVDVDDFTHGGQVGEGHTDDDVALQTLGICHCLTNFLGELYALGHGGIHLPVARNNVLSHFLTC